MNELIRILVLELGECLRERYHRLSNILRRKVHLHKHKLRPELKLI